MSLTNPTTSSNNPADLFLRWSSDQKTWIYWDKKEEKEKIIKLDSPFIVLDQLNTITGYVGS